jgi:hypothetical protein
MDKKEFGMIRKAQYSKTYVVLLQPNDKSKEMHTWAKNTLTGKYTTVNMRCLRKNAVEFWTFNEYKDAVRFSMKWSR